MKIIYIFILTLIRFCFSCKEPGQISFLPPFNDAEDFQSKISEDINIVCCHSVGADFLQWEDKNGNVITYKNSGGIFSLKDEKNRLILRIDNFDKSKAGKYTCKKNKSYLTKSINISFKDSPSIPIITKVEKLFPKNRHIKIECPLKENQVFKSWVYTEGSSNAYVNKTGRGKNYEVSEDRLTFTIIKNENVKSIKVLWCQYQEFVANELTSGLYEFSWILYDPIDIKIDLENKESIIEGQDVTMICSFNYNVAQAVQFPTGPLKNSIVVNQDLKNGRVEVIIQKITKDLEGQYECKVNKFLNTGQVAEETAKITINVTVPPKIIKNNLMNVTVKIDETAYLKCFINSKNLNENDVFFERFSSKDSSWIKINSNEYKYKVDFVRGQDKNTLSLSIKNVQWEDRGKYQCSASNAAGKDNMIGTLKVRKTPTLYTASDNLVMAVKPVEIDCSISGFPININDEVQLRVVNDTSPLVITKENTIFNEMEELKVIYKVAYQRKLIEGVNYLLECFYFGRNNQFKLIKNINLEFAHRPEIPKVSILCSGANGVVFQYEIPKETKTPKDVTKNELYYAPSDEFEKLSKKPFKIIPITEMDKEKKYFTYVLKNLMPSTNYSFKWESYNIYQIASSLNLNRTTNNLSPPQTPTSLKFSTGDGVINVEVNWEDDCPYSGANEAIKDVLVKMKLLGSGNEKDSNRWEWTVTNFTLNVESRLLLFPITLDRPQVNYEIEVVLRGAQGVSKPIIEVYRAENVLAGSLFSCFPRCLSQSLSSSFLLIQSAFLIYLGLFYTML